MFSKKSASLLENLQAELQKPDFKGVDSSLYGTSQLLKDVARASSKYQFLIVKPEKGGWELEEGAFGPPVPGSKSGHLLTQFDPQSRLIVLVCEGIYWDLLVARKGHELAFW